MKKLFALLISIGTALVVLSNPGTAIPINDSTPYVHVPEGFIVTIIANDVKGARHIAITRNGGIYVKLSQLKNGKGILYLKDKNGDGQISENEETGFGDYTGTGIYLKNGYLYASSNDEVFRYKLDQNEEVIDPVHPERIITGLVNHNRDNSKSIVLDNKGNIYVNVGSYLNACMISKDEKPSNPCFLLDSAGGIWQYRADRKDQTLKEGVHYATGLKNVVGLDWNRQTNSLFVMQHGRDNLHDLYPQYYTVQQDQSLPAETMYELHKGSNAGWPYVYYDTLRHKKILSPEYGGNGQKTDGAEAQDPVMAFPAHLAPNGLLFYTGKTFPSHYRNGAFIAFHGKSVPLDKGYLLAFVPFKKGKPSGPWEVFADHFTDMDQKQHKPCGLAQGPDGAIYVTDDANGTIYRIQYKR